MHRLSSCLLLLALLAALGGCGLKGPLYLPSAHPPHRNHHRHRTHAAATGTPAPVSSAPALPAADNGAGTGDAGTR